MPISQSPTICDTSDSSSPPPAAAPIMPLATPRIRLRRARLDDIPAFHEAYSDIEVMRYEGRLPHTDLAQTVKIVQGMIHDHEKAAKKGRVSEEFVIEKLVLPSDAAIVTSSSPTSIEEPIPIGKVVLYEDSKQQLQIGYIVFKQYWRQGYATEAVGTLLEWAFRTQPRLHDAPDQESAPPRILTDIDPRNVASHQLLQQKFGFIVAGQAEKTWQVGEEWTDSIYLAVDRQLFQKSGWQERYLGQHASLPQITFADDSWERNKQIRKQQKLAPLHSTSTTTTSPATSATIAPVLSPDSASPSSSPADPVDTLSADTAAFLQFI